MVQLMAEIDFISIAQVPALRPFSSGTVTSSDGTTPVWVYYTVVTAAKMNALLYLCFILDWCL